MIMAEYEIGSWLHERSSWRNLATGDWAEIRNESGYVDGWGFPSWEDHFLGTSLNSSDWNVREGYQDAQDASTMRAANVTVADSNCTISAKWADSEDPNDGNGRSITSGYFDSIGKWSRRYGRFECKVIVPTYPNVSRGVWPAVWLRDNNGGGEIDIFEAIGSPNNHPTRWPASPGRHSHALYRQTGVQNEGEWWHSGECVGMDTADGLYHTFACEWTPSRFTLFHDGFPVFTNNFTGINPGFPSEVNWRIDMFMGSSWQGWPNETDTQLPAEYKLDYLRYWTLPEGMN